jgi:hypothetical protein
MLELAESAGWRNIRGIQEYILFDNKARYYRCKVSYVVAHAHERHLRTVDPCKNHHQQITKILMRQRGSHGIDTGRVADHTAITSPHAAILSLHYTRTIITTSFCTHIHARAISQVVISSSDVVLGCTVITRRHENNVRIHSTQGKLKSYVHDHRDPLA